MGLSRFFYKNTLVDVYVHYGRFYVGLKYNDIPATLADTLERWPALKSLRHHYPNGLESESEIPIHRLAEFLELISYLQSSCAKIKKIRFEVRPEVRRARVLSAPPADFICSWRWRGSYLSLDYGADIAELQEGWYRRGDEYWRYPMMSGRETERMRRKRIEKTSLSTFLQRTFRHTKGPT